MLPKTIVLLIAVSAAAFTLNCRAAEPGTTGKFLEDARQNLAAADAARDANEFGDALQFYRDALTRFIDISKTHPELEPEVIRFRISYCDAQIEKLMFAAGKKNNVTRLRTPDAEIIAATNPAPSPAPLTALSPLSPAELAKAKQYIAAGTPDKAMPILTKLLQTGHSDPEIRLLIATAQCRAGRFVDAVSTTIALLEDEPDNARAFLLLATAYFGLADIEHAEASMLKSIEIAPNIPEAHFNMTQILLAKKPFDEETAKRHYRKSIELGGAPDPSLAFLLK